MCTTGALQVRFCKPCVSLVHERFSRTKIQTRCYAENILRVKRSKQKQGACRSDALQGCQVRWQGYQINQPRNLRQLPSSRLLLTASYSLSLLLLPSSPFESLPSPPRHQQSWQRSKLIKNSFMSVSANSYLPGKQINALEMLSSMVPALLSSWWENPKSKLYFTRTTPFMYVKPQPWCK